MVTKIKNNRKFTMYRVYEKEEKIIIQRQAKELATGKYKTFTKQDALNSLINIGK